MSNKKGKISLMQFLQDDENNNIRDRLQISFLILSQYMEINFYAPWNHQGTIGFLMISGGIEVN